MSTDREFTYVLKNLSEILLNFAQDFTQIKQGLTQLLESPLFKSSTWKKENTSSFIAFPDIAQYQLIDLPGHQKIISKIEEFVQNEIHLKQEEFHSMSLSLIAKLAAFNDTYNAQRTIYETAYNEYKEAGERFHEVTRSDSNFNELKTLMIEKRVLARKAHENYQIELDALTDKIESIMTEFEKIEFNRLGTVQNILYNSANLMRDLGKNFGHNPTSISNAFAKIEDKLKGPPRGFLDPLADDSKRIGSVSSEITAYLPHIEIFQEEITAKKSLVKAISDHVPKYGDLPAVRNEVFVVVDETTPERTKCRNFNGSIGFLPNRILTKIV